MRDGVRLLGQGELKTKVSFEVTGASSGAVKAVEAAGGTVTLTPLPQRTAKPEGKGKPKKERKSAAELGAPKKEAPAKKAAAKKTAAKKDTSE